MIKKVLLVVFLSTLLFSCKSSKTNTSAVTAKLSSKKIINNHYTGILSGNIKANMLIKYQGNSEIPEINASLRIAKDSAIWLSFSKLGFPVGKLLITPNRVQFYEKINKSYFDGDFGLISKWMGTDFDFVKLQNLFLGEALLNLKDQKYVSSIEQNNYMLIPKEKNPIFDVSFLIDPIVFKIKKETFKNVQKGQVLAIQYKEYSELDDFFIPKGFTINARGRSKTTTIDVDLKKIEKVSKIGFPFEIPDNYKKIKLK